MARTLEGRGGVRRGGENRGRGGEWGSGRGVEEWVEGGWDRERGGWRMGK